MKPDRQTWPWSISDEVRLKSVKDALAATGGNVKRAAEALEMSRSHFSRLVKRYELGEFAAELRLKAGGTRVTSGERKGSVLGRPKK